jgi:hypothetical protein
MQPPCPAPSPTARHLVRALLAACWLAGPPQSAAHPVHATDAEADFNRETGRVEVSLRVFADDLEAALSKEAGERITLDRTPPAELDRRIRGLAAGRFCAQTALGDPAPLHWVGREPERREALPADESRVILYFELPLSGGLEGARLWQGLFCGLFDDQINLVHLRQDGRRVTLGFAPGREEKTVAFPR